MGPWSGITVVRGQAMPLVYLGFALIACGVWLIYFFSPRRIRFRIEPLAETGYGVTMTASGCSRGSIFWDQELQTIRQHLTSLC
jgi:hypothetical protein